MKKLDKGFKELVIMFCMFFGVITIAGCSTASVSLMDVTNDTDQGIYRSCSFWSGNNIRAIEVPEGTLEVKFITNLEDGSISFAVVDRDGNEIYQKTEETAGTLTGAVTVPEAGKYTISTTASKFKGNYEIQWKN